MRVVEEGTPSEGGLRELASGVDALYLSGRAVLPEPFVECLAAARAQAEASGSSQAVSIAGVEFDVASHGMGRYRYCLSHRYGQVGVSPSTHLPALRVQPWTQFLHGIGVREACGVFMELLGEELGACVLTVSRLDLYVDVQGTPFETEPTRAHEIASPAFIPACTALLVAAVLFPSSRENCAASRNSLALLRYFGASERRQLLVSSGPGALSRGSPRPLGR